MNNLRAQVKTGPAKVGRQRVASTPTYRGSMTTDPPECAYLPPDTTGTLASPGMSPGDTQAWIDRHGCHAAATWAIVTHGQAEATYACAAHLAELCDHGDTVLRVDGEVPR